jgi:putative serine protease PepD
MTSLRRAGLCLCAATVVAVLPLLVGGCGGSRRPDPPRPVIPSRSKSSSSASSNRSNRRSRRSGQKRLGSGVVFDTRGDIVTNAHVIDSGGNLVVTLADGHRYPATVVGSYAPDDPAVVTIGPGRSLKLAKFADSSKVEVGTSCSRPVIHWGYRAASPMG